MKKNNETIYDNQTKYFIRLETDEEGIRQYKEAPDSEKAGTSLGMIRIEGKLIPAILLEVDKPTYDEFQREIWKTEDRHKQENRCIICGKNEKSMRCPIRIPNPQYTDTNGEPKTLANDCSNCPYGYHKLFHPIKGKIHFSSLDIMDDNGNIDEFDPEAAKHYSEADIYVTMLKDLINYIHEKYPQYPEYLDFISLLGNEIDLKEAAAIIGRPKSTLYGWLKKLRPIFDEFIESVDIL